IVKEHYPERSPGNATARLAIVAKSCFRQSRCTSIENRDFARTLSGGIRPIPKILSMVVPCCWPDFPARRNGADLGGKKQTLGTLTTFLRLLHGCFCLHLVSFRVQHHVWCICEFAFRLSKWPILGSRRASYEFSRDAI